MPHAGCNDAVSEVLLDVRSLKPIAFPEAVEIEQCSHGTAEQRGRVYRHLPCYTTTVMVQYNGLTIYSLGPTLQKTNSSIEHHLPLIADQQTARR